VSFGSWIAQFLGVTSGWTGVTITKFFTVRSLFSYQTVLSLGQFLVLSAKWRVSEHVVTYTRAWWKILSSLLLTSLDLHLDITDPSNPIFTVTAGISVS
jgi:hypothetical protein